MAFRGRSLLRETSLEERQTSSTCTFELLSQMKAQTGGSLKDYTNHCSPDKAEANRIRTYLLDQRWSWCDLLSCPYFCTPVKNGAWWQSYANLKWDATEGYWTSHARTCQPCSQKEPSSHWKIWQSREENPQKLTQLSSRSHPRHLVWKGTAQKDTIIDITSDSQENSIFPYRWSPASLTFNNYFYLFLYLYITWITINNNAPHLKSPKNQNRRAAFGRPAIKNTRGGGGGFK